MPVENRRVIRLWKSSTYAEPYGIFALLIHLVDYYYMLSGGKSVFWLCALWDNDVLVHG